MLVSESELVLEDEGIGPLTQQCYELLEQNKVLSDDTDLFDRVMGQQTKKLLPVPRSDEEPAEDSQTFVSTHDDAEEIDTPSQPKLVPAFDRKMAQQQDKPAENSETLVSTDEKAESGQVESPSTAKDIPEEDVQAISPSPISSYDAEISEPGSSLERSASSGSDSIDEETGKERANVEPYVNPLHSSRKEEDSERSGEDGNEEITTEPAWSELGNGQ